MDNPGEVLQILSGINFDRNNIFWCGKKLLIVLKITCMWLLSASKNIVPIKSYATFKSSKFATLGGGGGQLKKSLKKSKSISGILGWVLTFFDSKF